MSRFPTAAALSTSPSFLIPYVSQIQSLTSKISHICQEIHDIKRRRKPKSNLAIQNYINTGLDEGRTDQSYTREPNSSSSAWEDNNDGGDSDDTYSSRSTQYHPAPNNLNTSSHHAPIPPSPNLSPSESILEPPGDLSPSPASRIATETPSLLSKLARKACNAALSSSVHTNPSGPCAAWNVLLSTQNGLGEESEEELGMTEESSLLMGERGGGLGVGGLCPERGGGTGMAIDKEGGAKADHTQSGIGSPSPLQVQHMEL